MQYAFVAIGSHLGDLFEIGAMSSARYAAAELPNSL